MQEQLITIGVPTYNRPEGLRHTLECLHKQTYKNLRIVISDNCSDAEELVNSIVNEFIEKDSRIEFFRQKSNIGAIKNLIFLLDKAQTEFFMWAADDDEFSESLVEELQHTLLKSSDAAVVISGVKVTDKMEAERPITIELTQYLQKLSGSTAFERFNNYIKQPVEHGRARILWGLCRRETLSRAVNDIVNRSDKAEILWIDFPVDLQILKYGDVIVVPKELFHVYLLPSSDGLREGNLFDKKEIKMCKRSYDAYRRVVSNSTFTSDQKKYLNMILIKQERKDLIKIIPFYFIKRFSPWLARNLKKLYFKFI